MRGVREGSQDAGWKLVETYGPHILRVVRRSLSQDLRTKFDSIDFVQAVWASIFAEPTRLATFEQPEQLIAYLAAVARNKVVDEFRRRVQTQKFDVKRERASPFQIQKRFHLFWMPFFFWISQSNQTPYASR